MVAGAARTAFFSPRRRRGMPTRHPRRRRLRGISARHPTDYPRGTRGVAAFAEYPRGIPIHAAASPRPPPPRNIRAASIPPRRYLRSILAGRHARAFQAFGVDVDAAAAICAGARGPPVYDYVFAGAFADHVGLKRPERLADVDGRRLAIGKIRDNAGGISDLAKAVVERLEASGVEVREQVAWEELLKLMARSRFVYARPRGNLPRLRGLSVSAGISAS